MAGKNQLVSFSCPNCGSRVDIRAAGLTVHVACVSCGSLIDATDPNFQIIEIATKKLRLKPLIELGTKGKLRGQPWQLIGFMQRTDGSGEYAWEEYLLFNPWLGFRWLVEADGHWNLVRM